MAGDPADWPVCEHCGHGQPVHRSDCPVVSATPQPPTSDALALALARLAEAFTALSALADAVDALPDDQARGVSPSTSAAFGALTEAEDTLTAIVADGAR
jgi:hypothetical protein